MFSTRNLLKLTKLNPFNKNLNFKFIKRFSEIVPSATRQEKEIPQTLDELIYKNSSLTAEEIATSQRLGVDLFLNQQKLSVIENSGFYFNSANNNLNLSAQAQEGWRLKYLKNMNLLLEYDDLFREFIQNCARVDTEGIDICAEPRLADFMINKILELKSYGFNLEINTIKIRQSHKILRMEIYKNLFIDRKLNADYSKYNFSKVPTGLATTVVAKEPGKDYSIALNKKPFILATTMLVQSPIKLCVWNQNQSKEFKLMEQDVYEYVVRFETQMTYSDFGWILPTQNKPSRMNDTKITDFNNVLRGNPYFADKFDLIDENLRYKYMVKDSKLDEDVKEIITGKKTTSAI